MIAEKNPRYRTKEQLAQDVFEVLQSQALSFAAKMAVIAEVLWVWSEFDGKYEGNPLVSTDARVIMQRGNRKANQLVHEHIIPRKLMYERLFNADPAWTKWEEIKEFLTIYCVAVVVTKAEDTLLNKEGLRQKMPSDPWVFSQAERFGRYERVGVEVVDAQTGSIVASKNHKPRS